MSAVELFDEPIYGEPSCREERCLSLFDSLDNPAKAHAGPDESDLFPVQPLQDAHIPPARNLGGPLPRCSSISPSTPASAKEKKDFRKSGQVTKAIRAQVGGVAVKRLRRWDQRSPPKRKRKLNEPEPEQDFDGDPARPLRQLAATFFTSDTLRQAQEHIGERSQMSQWCVTHGLKRLAALAVVAQACIANRFLRHMLRRCSNHCCTKCRDGGRPVHARSAV